MTRPVHFIRRHWQAIVIGFTGVIVTATCVLAVWTALNGAATNRILAGQAETDAAAECRSTYAAADRIASGNLDITKAEEIDLFAQAALIGDVAPLSEQFDRAHQRTAEAIAQRDDVNAIQAHINANCDPGRHPDGLVPAPAVERVRPLEEP